MTSGISSYFRRQPSTYEPLSSQDKEQEQEQNRNQSTGSSDSASSLPLELDGGGEKEYENFLSQSDDIDNKIQSKLRKFDFGIISLAICLATVIFNALILYALKPATGLASEPNVNIYALNNYKPPNGEKLERPSQFRGLDKINRTSLEGIPMEERTSIINFPIIVGRVDGSWTGWRKVITFGKESRRFDLDSKGFEARAVELNKDISTVIQFRMIDWGMEQCDLIFHLPSQSILPSRIEYGSSNAQKIEIYRLPDTDTMYDIHQLSYSSLHSLGPKIGTTHLPSGHDEDMEWSYRFPCPMDSIQTFVLKSSPENESHASLKWWQDKQSLVPAVYIKQYATEGIANADDSSRY